ncbi:hsp70-like protein [Phytophthora cinnamomi]|uniref:hsp70-like protein n=1 Tax=Phytophthora cinnamomi TaxID=4785 RepID=UPI00355A4784|nr:hsp70-like protein [Phytophthora cinnamomi]
MSTSTETQIEIDSLHEGVDFHLPVSRSQFEKCCADLFDKAVEAVEKVLEDAKVKKCQVDEIVLVGGSSRIPKMQQLLSKLFDGRKLAGTITKEEAAAIGAAIQAAVLAGDDVPKLQDLLLLNVMSMSLQMEVNGAKTVVIPRNCTIPMKRTQTISTSPGKNSVVRFHFFEGDSENARGNLQLGILDMDGVLIDKAEFDVTIDIDASSNWSASVVEKLTGKEKEFTINCSSLPASEAGSALKDAEKDKSSRRVSGALGKVRSMFSGFMPRGSKQKSKLKLRQSAEDETKQRQVDSTGTKLDHIKISLASVGAK